MVVYITDGTESKRMRVWQIWGICMKKRNQNDKSVINALAMVTQFGINMLVPICMMSALGIYLDHKLGTSYIVIILFFVGAAAGARNVYHMAKRIYKSAEDKDSAESVIGSCRKKDKKHFPERKSDRKNGNTGAVEREEQDST